MTGHERNGRIIRNERIAWGQRRARIPGTTIAAVDPAHGHAMLICIHNHACLFNPGRSAKNAIILHRLLTGFYPARKAEVERGKAAHADPPGTRGKAVPDAGQPGKGRQRKNADAIRVLCI